MRILFSPCHYVYDRSNYGSEQSWAYNIADNLAKSNEVTVVTGEKSKNLNDISYNVIELKKNNGKIDAGILNGITFTIFYIIKTYFLNFSNNFDIIHHVLPFRLGRTFNLYFLFPLKRSKLVIGPVQDLVYNRYSKIPISEAIFENVFGKIARFMSIKTLERADAVIVINDNIRSNLISLGIDAGKIFVIPPGIDMSMFKMSKNKSTSNLTIMTAGNLIKRKRVDLVILAFKEIIKNNKNARLLILGDGEERNNLELLVAKNKLQDKVKFVGRISNKEMEKYYSISNIYLSMSEEESWGQVYLEAMASGIPVVAVRNKGSEIIITNNKTGMLIDLSDIHEAANAINSLVLNKKRYKSISRKAREEVEGRYDWKKVIQKYVKVYNS